MTKINYLKFLIRTKQNHQYKYEEININNRSEVNSIIDELISKPSTDEAYIDILESEFEDQIFKIKDEFSNYRYFLKLSETTRTMRVLELLSSDTKGFRFKLISKSKGEVIGDSIRASTQNSNEAQFKLSADETKILIDFMQYITYMNTIGFSVEDYTIAASKFTAFYGTKSMNIFKLDDEEIKILDDIKSGRKQLIDDAYNVKIIDELMSKLDKDTSIEDLIDRIKQNDFKDNIEVLIQEFEQLLNLESALESSWSGLFNKYKTIFAMLFGDFNSDVLNSEVQVSTQVDFNDKIEKVDKAIVYNKTLCLVELKRHDKQIFEVTGDSRQNIHLSKIVHNGVMQLMYYISPNNTSDSTKNYIKKKNYLIIGDEEHSSNYLANFTASDCLKALDLYNNYLDNDIQVLTYRMVLEMLKRIKANF
ncbi:MAG: Shedu anti-phage system protein SduA domain-containing protein [Pikeienuella sp.]